MNHCWYFLSWAWGQNVAWVPKERIPIHKEGNAPGSIRLKLTMTLPSAIMLSGTSRFGGRGSVSPPIVRGTNAWEGLWLHVGELPIQTWLSTLGNRMLDWRRPESPLSFHPYNGPFCYGFSPPFCWLSVCSTMGWDAAQWYSTHGMRKVPGFVLSIALT